MSQTYTTSEGDVADEIAWKYYGTRDGRTVERLLDANPGLAAYGAQLPAGVIVTLPEMPPPATKVGIRLWD